MPGAPAAGAAVSTTCEPSRNGAVAAVQFTALGMKRHEDAVWKALLALPAEASAATVLAHPQVRAFYQALVDKLAPTDDFSLVTFSSDARTAPGVCAMSS